MGIKNLFDIVKLRKVQLEDLTNYKTIAVDISCWLHKVKYANNCALATNENDVSWKYVFKSIFKKLSAQHKLIFVFDGVVPLLKRPEHEKRRFDNTNIKKMGKELLKNKETKSKGLQMLVKTIEISNMYDAVKDIIVNDLKSTFVVAEFEADQKLAHMSIRGMVDLVMTEDSDLIVYGNYFI
jgi:exonuclease-1